MTRFEQRKGQIEDCERSEQSCQPDHIFKIISSGCDKGGQDLNRGKGKSKIVSVASNHVSPTIFLASSPDGEDR